MRTHEYFTLLSSIILFVAPHHHNAIGCPDVLNRNVWTATEPLARENLPVPVQYIVVHELTGLNRSMTQHDCTRYINALQSCNMNQNGYDDIVFNFIICGGDENDNGSQQQIYTGRGWKTIGAHCITYNSRSLGIATVRNYTNKKSLNAFKSLMECGITNKFIEQNYSLVGHYASSNIYKFYLEYFKNTTQTKYMCQSRPSNSNTIAANPKEVE
ncbi:unnamed protein product [Didymodactylos carnosus]|nr:unnamed protein product [Didymodactylos carnosus]CAF3928699.1 unnamed protein product [Didymodactylos carnosus]